MKKSPPPSPADRILGLFNLPPAGAERDAAIAGRVAQLAYSDPAEITALVRFAVEQLPERLTRHAATPGYRAVAEAYARIVAQLWECNSLFPADAEGYAHAFRAYLDAPETHPQADAVRALAALLDEQDGRCGLQDWRPANGATIRDSEAALKGGSFDAVLKARVKYDVTETALADSDFARDWAALRALYPLQTAVADEAILHRTLVPERKWNEPEAAARFDSEDARFRAHFDALCWKYCLWGVVRDRPLLMKPSVNLTPYGTQIFIPAYLSFDPRRDLDLGAIAALHRARGVPRQGEALAEGRRVKQTKIAAVTRADSEARRRGLRGHARFDFIRKTARLPLATDEAQIRRWLKQG